MTKKRCTICSTKYSSDHIHSILKDSGNIYICIGCYDGKIEPYVNRNNTDSNNMGKKKKSSTSYDVFTSDFTEQAIIKENSPEVLDLVWSNDPTEPILDNNIISEDAKIDLDIEEKISKDALVEDEIQTNAIAINNESDEECIVETKTTSNDTYKLFLVCNTGHMSLATSTRPFLYPEVKLADSSLRNYLSLIKCGKTDTVFAHDSLIHPSIMRNGEIHSAAERLCNTKVEILEQNNHILCLNSTAVIDKLGSYGGLSTVQYKSTRENNEIENDIAFPYLKHECIF